MALYHLPRPSLSGRGAKTRCASAGMPYDLCLRMRTALYSDMYIEELSALPTHTALMRTGHIAGSLSLVSEIILKGNLTIFINFLCIFDTDLM